MNEIPKQILPEPTETKPSIYTRLQHKAEANKEAVIIMASFFVFGFVIVTITLSYLEYRMNLAAPRESVDTTAPVERPKEEPAPVAPYNQYDTSSWNTYTNQWYGVAIKYPKPWQKPQLVKRSNQDQWETRYAFRPVQASGSAVQHGFDLVIYHVRTVKQLDHTKEFPARKPGMETDQQCSILDGRMIDHDDFAAEEIRISPDDPCFGPGFFFTLRNSQYIYVLLPYPGSKADGIDPYLDIIQSFPEFFDIATTFQQIKIDRHKSAPKRVVSFKGLNNYKVTQGKRVCPHPSRKPERGGSGNHMDEDCCPDPDEWPHPACTYSAKDYSIMMKR